MRWLVWVLMALSGAAHAARRERVAEHAGVRGMSRDGLSCRLIEDAAGRLSLELWNETDQPLSFLHEAPMDRTTAEAGFIVTASAADGPREIAAGSIAPWQGAETLPPRTRKRYDAGFTWHLVQQAALLRPLQLRAVLRASVPFRAAPEQWVGEISCGLTATSVVAP
jgi:hypothetical protein